eukprot:16794-Pyramimonas_sp.AAC.1
MSTKDWVSSSGKRQAGVQGSGASTRCASECVNKYVASYDREPSSSGVALGCGGCDEPSSSGVALGGGAVFTELHNVVCEALSHAPL